jgi:dihydrofolate reductase
MARLTYLAITSLDGFIEDKDGRFDWSVPDEEVHQYVNELVRAAGIYLYGRRMYETMAVWETDPGFAAESSSMRDFAAIWQAADKLVFSRTLEGVSTARTRLERVFNPAAIQQLKVTAVQELLIGGPELAAQAFGARLVDECHLLLAPVVVGGGKRALPEHLRLELELLAERRFGNGMVHLHYRIKS